MHKKVRLFTVLAAAFVIVASGLMIMNRMDDDIRALEDVATEARIRQLAMEQENGELAQELRNKDSDAYIIEKARTLYSYLMPGEIRFVVDNPEVLYDEDQPTPSPEAP